MQPQHAHFIVTVLFGTQLVWLSNDLSPDRYTQLAALAPDFGKTMLWAWLFLPAMHSNIKISATQLPF